MLIWRTLSTASIVSCFKSLVSKPDEAPPAAAGKPDTVAAGPEPR